MAQQDPSESSRIVPVELSEASRAVAEMEATLLGGDRFVLDDYLESLVQWPDQIIAAHARHMDASSVPALRIFHAALVLLADDAKADMIPPGLVTRATECLTVGSTATRIDRWMSAALPAQLGVVPMQVRRYYLAMFAEEDPALRTAAAAALSCYLSSGASPDGAVNSGGTSVSVGEIAACLRDGLQAVGVLTGAIAARCLARLHASDGDRHLGQQAMLAWLEVVSELSEVYAVIEALEEIGHPAPVAVKQRLHEIAADEARGPLVRGVAARTFVRVAEDNDIDAFIALLSLDSDAVRHGLVESLAGRAPLDQAVLRAATTYLHDDDSRLRRRVARMLSEWPAGAKQSLPSLLERVGKELDLDALDALADAIASVGPEVADQILALLGTRNVAVISVVSLVLRRLGEEGARALMRALLSRQDLMSRSLLLGVMRDMGPAARAVVPELGQLLLVTEQEDYAYIILHAIVGTGRSAIGALPALIKTVLHRKGVLAEWASKAIRDIGPDAVPQVRAALASASGPALALLERAIMWAPADARAFSRLQKIAPEKIVLFYHATGIWMKKGRMALADVAQELQADKRLPPTIKRSESTLQRAIKDLQEAFGRKRLVQGASRLASEVTDHGRDVRTHIHRYAQQMEIDLYERED